jgi:hypothetical protein
VARHWFRRGTVTPDAEALANALAQTRASRLGSPRRPGWTNLEAPQLAAGSHLHWSLMRSSALGQTPCLRVVRCGSGPEDGADACSSAEGRVSLFRLTSRDRYTSPNQAYGTPISAEALAAAAAWGPVRCRSACGHARSLAVMPAARTWAVSSAFGRRVASPEATRRCPSVALRGRAPTVTPGGWRGARRGAGRPLAARRSGRCTAPIRPGRSRSGRSLWSLTPRGEAAVLDVVNFAGRVHRSPDPDGPGAKNFHVLPRHRLSIISPPREWPPPALGRPSRSPARGSARSRPGAWAGRSPVRSRSPASL